MIERKCTECGTIWLVGSDKIKECPNCDGELVDVQKISRDKLLEFANWVAKEVIDDDLWEINHYGFPEIACRKLVKLGIMKEEGDTYTYEYEENEDEE